MGVPVIVYGRSARFDRIDGSPRRAGRGGPRGQRQRGLRRDREDGLDGEVAASKGPTSPLVPAFDGLWLAQSRTVSTSSSIFLLFLSGRSLPPRNNSLHSWVRQEKKDVKNNILMFYANKKIGNPLTLVNSIYTFSWSSNPTKSSVAPAILLTKK